MSQETGAPPGKPRLARKARLKYDAIEKQHMLLYPERGMKLSESAAEILKRCDGARSVEAIAEELAAASGTPIDAVLKDVSDFVEEMRKRSLVEIV